jgi:cytochrome c biogenesis protein CcmG/thiol:disulfide interchange protein DsbE
VLQGTAVAVLAGLVALLVWQLAHRDDGGRFAAAVDRGDAPAAPDFRLAYLSRPGQLDLSSLRGHPVVVNFWASWCTGCTDEARRLSALAARWQPRGVRFVGIDQQDLIGDARSFARRYRMDYTLVHEQGNATQRRYGVQLLPETYVIDADGRAIVHVGSVIDAQGAARIEQALREAGGTA